MPKDSDESKQEAPGTSVTVSLPALTMSLATILVQVTYNKCLVQLTDQLHLWLDEGPCPKCRSQTGSRLVGSVAEK